MAQILRLRLCKYGKTLTGKTILQENRICAAGNQTFVFDLKEAAPGFYLLSTLYNHQPAISKLEIR
ncbi:MAG: hypothetical protein NTV01_02260 [Bacteroidia bacterium]|nr:hypothetical protein [Bacteroidia bacterium]